MKDVTELQEMDANPTGNRRMESASRDDRTTAHFFTRDKVKHPGYSKYSTPRQRSPLAAGLVEQTTKDNIDAKPLFVKKFPSTSKQRNLQMSNRNMHTSDGSNNDDITASKSSTSTIQHTSQPSGSKTAFGIVRKQTPLSISTTQEVLVANKSNDISSPDTNTPSNCSPLPSSNQIDPVSKRSPSTLEKSSSLASPTDTDTKFTKQNTSTPTNGQESPVDGSTSSQLPSQPNPHPIEVRALSDIGVERRRSSLIRRRNNADSCNRNNEVGTGSTSFAELDSLDSKRSSILRSGSCKTVSFDKDQGESENEIKCASVVTSDDQAVTSGIPSRASSRASSRSSVKRRSFRTVAAIAMDAISRRRDRISKVIKRGSEFRKSKIAKQVDPKQVINSKMWREYSKNRKFEHPYGKTTDLFADLLYFCACDVDFAISKDSNSKYYEESSIDDSSYAKLIIWIAFVVFMVSVAGAIILAAESSMSMRI